MQHAIIADEMNGAAVGTKVPHDGRERIAVAEAAPARRVSIAIASQAFNCGVAASPAL